MTFKKMLRSWVKTAHLGARDDRLAAANATVLSAEYLLAQFEKKLQDAAPVAIVAGVVEETYFQPGEYVSAGHPVVNILPSENVKVRFFVPQAVMPTLHLGQSIRVMCDGCAELIDARITYIASHAEYTPPVIFSVESRDKLVFLIEAKPTVYHRELRPGLPVDIDTGS